MTTKEILIDEIAQIDSRLAKGDPALKAAYEKIRAAKVEQLGYDPVTGEESTVDSEVTVDETVAENAPEEIATESEALEVGSDATEEPAEESTSELGGQDVDVSEDAEVVDSSGEEFACGKCDKVCASSAGLSAHKRHCKA